MNFLKINEPRRVFQTYTVKKVVRVLGKSSARPKEINFKHPFPGPGLH